MRLHIRPLPFEEGLRGIAQAERIECVGDLFADCLDDRVHCVDARCRAFAAFAEARAAETGCA